MKKFLSRFILIILFLQTFSLQAFPNEGCYSYDEYCTTFTLEAECAGFCPLNSTMRRIYGSLLPSFTLEGNLIINRRWGLWLDGSYIFANGRSSGVYHDSTHLSLVPISVGAKYYCPVNEWIDLYLGIGACYSFLNTTDHSEYVHEKTSASNSGAIIKSGFIYRYCDCFFFHGFFDYMYQKMYFHKTESDPFVYRNDANLSSLQFGVGIGLEF